MANDRISDIDGDSNLSKNQADFFATGAAKLLIYRGHIEDWLRGRATIPITLEIHPTEQCNQHCPSCQAKYALKNAEVHHRARNGAHLQLDLIDQVLEKPPQGIVISGNTGDPLVYPEIGSLLKKIELSGVPTVLITNGLGLTLELSEAIVATCAGVRISLDAHDADSYRVTHGVHPDFWDRVISNVQLLLETRRRLGAEREQCSIGAGYLTGTQTTSGMTEATKLVRQLGLDYIQFRPFHYDTTNISPELRSCLEFETQHFHVFASHQKYSRFGGPLRDYSTCHGSWFYSVLDARGDLYICCHHVGNPRGRIGAVGTEGWQCLLESSIRRQVVESFDVSRCTPFCRLDSQNRALQAIQNTRQIPVIQLTGLARKHAPFL